MQTDQVPQRVICRRNQRLLTVTVPALGSLPGLQYYSFRAMKTGPLEALMNPCRAFPEATEAISSRAETVPGVGDTR